MSEQLHVPTIRILVVVIDYCVCVVCGVCVCVCVHMHVCMWVCVYVRVSQCLVLSKYTVLHILAGV